ncbi:putative late blight resistance protein homolog R1A-10 [Lycium ferocissimum]|uniref:putative late blight resistance protein homolog R1A-10 n=1 Tax=Lycium ferocissimum TaxID=112874 RepID=UPI002814E326|nr:putative late blight resistance protein homolog R1A-10 [Lycium ferocissimum]
MDSIQEQVVKFKNDYQHIKELPSTNASLLRSSGHVLDEETTLVGMEDVFSNIRDQLTGQASELNVVSIVGMGGIGKTTLAKIIFSDPSIVCRFDVSSWVIVSQEYDAREMLLDVLSFVTPGAKLIYHGKTYDQLLELVYRKLKCRRYLIVLDDVCSIEAWDHVIRSFPDDNNGSRIIITTRLLEVADSASNGCPPHHVPFLNSESSWNLLSDKVFGKEDCPPQLEEIGKQIAQQCQGLPLSAVVVAGLLSKIPKTYDDWKKAAENVISHVGSTSEQCLAILALSYNYLPCSLKACFLYMGLFAEDADINADYHEKLEEVAEECLVDLVSRSLIIVSRSGASGKIRSCRIHDLVRLLCLREGEAAKFFHVKGKYFKVSPEGKQVIRRLCLHPDDLQNKNLGLEKDSLDSVRTILCLGEPNTYLEDPECCKKINSRFQLLRVLDLESIRFSCFPSEITQLVQLRYVACTTGTDVPASISNLWNLQTLIVLPVTNQLSLPQEVWKLSSLRHFNPGGMCVHAPSITHNFLGLENLETVDSIRTANSNWKEIFSAVPRVQKLGVLIHPDHH